VSAKDTKIAVINRIKFLRTVTLRALSNLGFSTFLELDTNTQNCIKNLEKEAVIILEFPDPKNPQMEMECLKSLRRNDITKNSNIIVTVTSTGVDKKFVMSVVSMGVKDFILKSNDVSALSKRFEKALEKLVRKYKRTRFETPLNVYDDDTDDHLGMMQDITVGGFMMLCENSLEAERDYSVKVELPADLKEKTHLVLEANCRWCKEDDDGKYKVGFMLKDLSDEEKTVIEVLVKEYCTVDI
jgi:hypothetical protein